MAKKKVHKHKFAFKMLMPDDQWHHFEYWATVKTPKKAVDVTLTAADAEKSLKNDGCGNTQLCAMSNAISRQKALFPHPVIGIVDYHNATTYIASKKNKKGAIIECYRYLHSDDIAKQNDTPGHLKKLITDLQKNGDKIVRLRPRNRKGNRNKEGGTGRRTGERSSISAPRGDKLRYAIAQGGRFPPVPAV